MTAARAALVVVGGLPGAGKTTIASAYVRASRAAFVRIDTIEQIIVNETSLHQPLGPVGHQIGHAVAAEQLRLGVDVVTECVNPLAITRNAWARIAESAAAALVEVEVICSDPIEHRRRVETRTTDVPGLVLPSWQQVADREYEPWARDRLVLDTAESSVACDTSQVPGEVAHVLVLVPGLLPGRPRGEVPGSGPFPRGPPPNRACEISPHPALQ